METNDALAQSPLLWALERLHRLNGRPFTLYDYQLHVLANRSPRVLVLKSRQVGLSTAAAIRAAHELLFNERAMVLVVSRDQDAAGHFLATVLDILDSLAEPPDFTRRGVFEAQLKNGSRILSQAATGKAGRGVRATLVVCDEFAFMDYDAAIFRAVSPTIARGGRLIVISTPNGQNNLFFRLWHGNEGGDWSRHRVHWSDCPAFDPAWFERERPNYTARDWAQEFDLDFVASGGAAFRPEDVDAMADGWQGYQPRKDDERFAIYVTGVDVGRKHDATVLITLRTDRRPFQIVAFERLVGCPYAQQQALIEARAEAYGGKVIVESNGIGDPVLEALHCYADPFVTTQQSKAHGLTRLIQLVEQRQIKGDIPELLSELRSYEWEDSRLKTDCVMALMLACTGIVEYYVSFQELQDMMDEGSRGRGTIVTNSDGTRWLNSSCVEDDARADEAGAFHSIPTVF